LSYLLSVRGLVVRVAVGGERRVGASAALSGSTTPEIATHTRRRS
jgi:hypothetical protein